MQGTFESASVLNSVLLICEVWCLMSTCDISAASTETYGLNVTSVMLHHELSWNAPDPSAINYAADLRYTVWFDIVGSDEFSDDWLPVFDCIDINITHCDLDTSGTKIISDLKYSFRVNAKLLGSERIVYNTSILRFRPQHDTILVPPNFTLTYSEDVIFVRPTIHKITNGQAINQKIKELSHQVQYWPSDEITNIQNISAAELHNEITIHVRKAREYCVRLRLYAEGVGELGTSKNIHSPWSNPPVCVPTNDVVATQTYQEDISEVVKFVCVGIACVIFLMLSMYAAHQIRRKCKSVYKKGPLPEIMLRVFQENPTDPFTNNNEQMYNTYMAQEFVDPFPPIGSTMRSWRHESPQLTRENEIELSSSESTPDESDAESDYLTQPMDCDLPVFDEDAIPATCRINMTYGLGSDICESDIVYSSDHDQRFSLMSPSFCDRMEITNPWVTPPTDNSLTPFYVGDDVTFWTSNISKSQRPFSLATTNSTSSTGSEMGQLFDIQRSNCSPAMSNFYHPHSAATTASLPLSSTIAASENNDFETFNIAYSCIPSRDVPDILSNDYINV